MRIVFILLFFLIVPAFSIAEENSQKIEGYRNVKWNTSISSDFTKCVPSELFQLKHGVLACQYKYDDKTFGYIDNAYVSYIFYNKKLIAVRIAIFNNILDAQIITNKYGKPKHSYALLSVWEIGDTQIEYVAKGETRNKLTNEIISPVFTSVTYYNNAEYIKQTQSRSEKIYSNI